MRPLHYFQKPRLTAHKRYEALRMYFADKASPHEVAKTFGYQYRAFTSLVTDFKPVLPSDPLQEDPFFVTKKKGRPSSMDPPALVQTMVGFRKHDDSVEEIKGKLDTAGEKVSEHTIDSILKKQGFARLPKRSQKVQRERPHRVITAPKSEALSLVKEERFQTAAGGVLCFLPLIRHLGLDVLIEQSRYPKTQTISRVSSILSFLALKWSHFRRYPADDLWCMDRGLGLLAGLNH